MHAGVSKKARESQYLSRGAQIDVSSRQVDLRSRLPRGGYASAKHLQGESVAKIAAQLRHNDMRSLKTYLDAVAMMQPSNNAGGP